MTKVTSKELNRKFGEIRAKAHRGPVIITHHGRDDLALIPAEELKRYQELDPRRPQHFYAWEGTQQDHDAIVNSDLEMAPESEQLNHLLET